MCVCLCVFVFVRVFLSVFVFVSVSTVSVFVRLLHRRFLPVAHNMLPSGLTQSSVLLFAVLCVAAQPMFAVEDLIWY